MLNVWADISDAQYCHNELDNTLLSAHIIFGEYVARYITLSIQKVISLRNVLLGVNLVANAMLLCYVTHYFSLWSNASYIATITYVARYITALL